MKYTKDQIRETINYWAKFMESCAISINEGKSPLLNAREKTFGRDVVYDSSASFEMTKENLLKLFGVLDKSFFNNKFSKMEGLEIFAGTPEEINRKVRDEYNGDGSYDISGALASYFPNFKYETKAVCGKNRLIVRNMNDAIFINIDSGSFSTFAYALVVLCHEMIHCLDSREGTLKELTRFGLESRWPVWKISAESHRTDLFVKKVNAMKSQNGLTVPLGNEQLSYEDLNTLLQREAVLMAEAEHSPEPAMPYAFDMEYAEQNRDWLVRMKDGSFSIVFCDPAVGF